MKSNPGRRVALTALLVVSLATAARGQAPQSVFQAVLGTPGQKTAELSTDELKRVLAERSAVVLDARPFREFAISHIPGARNVAARSGVAMSMYVSDVAEIGRLLQGDKARAVGLYCNGPFCGKSARLAEELLAAGHTDVRRYQLGIPVWRALGGLDRDRTGGSTTRGRERSNRGAHRYSRARRLPSGQPPRRRNLPRSGVLEGKDVGEVRRAKDDGRLPMEDHNTRLIVVGRDAAEARHVAEAIGREAFHNVSYFPGIFEEAQTALRP